MGFTPLAAMWFVMMAAMMAPTVWPWVRSFHRLSPTGGTAQFIGGYLTAWLGYSIAAAFTQLTLQSFGTPPAVGALLFLGAGLYQFAPLKRACLTHCRSPLSYFLARWKKGPAGGFRMGLNHGVYCVGCCWAMMATTLAVGVMNYWWMAALAGIALLEQTAPHGHKLRVPIGIALVSAGIWWFSAGGQT